MQYLPTGGDTGKEMIMARTAFRKKLTDKEWNALLKLTSNTHLDESFDAYTKRNGEDAFKDYEDGRIKSLHWGLVQLYECIAYPFKHDGMNEDESKTLVELFKEFKIGNEHWHNWLLSDGE